MLDWIDVQPSKYSYTTFIGYEEIIVKMIFSKFLYPTVVFK